MKLSAEKRALLEMLRKERGIHKSRDVIPKRPSGPDARASFAQERLWFLDQLEPGQTIYNELEALRLEGDLDRDEMARALNDVGARHESLRTIFAADGGAPKQRILDTLPPDIRFVDADGPEEEVLAALVEEELDTPFDLGRGPLWRVRIVATGAQRHLFLLTMHHIVSDGWSLGVLVREVIALYAAYVEGRASPLEALPTQYPDVALWQRERLERGLLEPQLAYWRSALDGVAPLALPTDRPHPEEQRYEGSTTWFDLSTASLQALRGVCKEEEATEFMGLLATFAMLLGRTSGQTDIAIGTPVAGRSHPDTLGLIGLFVNTLVMRIDLSGRPTFRQVLRRVRDVTLGAYENQDVPFERIVEALRPERTLRRPPLFQVLFVHQTAPIPRLELPGITVDRLEPQRRSVKFELQLEVQPVAGRTRGKLDFARSVFDESTTAALVRRFSILLEHVGRQPDRCIDELSIIDATERHAVLEQFNPAPRVLGSSCSLHGWVAEAADRWPNRTAARCGDAESSYQQLWSRSQELAAGLRSRGIGRGSLVAVSLPRSVAMLETLLAVLSTGAAYLPLDPNYPAERVAYILEDSGCALLVTDAPPSAAHVPTATVSGLGGHEEEVAPFPVGPDDLAYVIYTSGSTGRPKGVEVRHGGVVNFLRAMVEAPKMSSGDTLVAVTTLSFDIAVLELFLPLVVGGRVIIAAADVALDGHRLAELLAASEATHLQATPSTWRLLREAHWKGSIRGLCGGEALPVALARDLRHAGVNLFNMYGPTETTIWSTMAAIPDDVATVSIGTPIANTIVRVLDERLELTPIGVPGELYIGGDGLARGYRARPGMTAERFVPDPFVSTPGARLYRTGDIVLWEEDGSLRFLGRVDQQVKVRGFRIELGEVESVFDEHPSIVESVVVTRPDAIGTKTLVAYVAARRQTHDDEDEQRARVEHWRDVWNDAYDHDGVAEASFDISGWRDSYGGSPIPPDHMRRWVDARVARILDLQPRRVLELGCGTGLLLYRVAPHVEAMTGWDISPVVVERLARAVGGQDLAHVSVEQRDARDFSEVRNACFDLTIINSVAQYMPSLSYFDQVLEQAIRATVDGGKIFLGDLRSLPQLEAFTVGVVLARIEGQASARRVQGEARGAMLRERELLFDPARFYRLAADDPRVARVDIELERGTDDNELLKYRYDVVVHVGPPTRSPVAEERPWSAAAEGIEDVVRWARESTVPLRVLDVPNRRLAVDRAWLRQLREGDRNAEEMGAHAASAVDGVHPEDFWTRHIGAKRVAIRPASSGRADAFDVEVFDADDPPAPSPRSLREGTPHRALANAPLLRAPGPELARQLRAWAGEQLPDYMVPSRIVVLDELPRTPNNKIDRRRLPDPGSVVVVGDDLVEAKGPVEQALAAIYSELLDTRHLSVTDDFFALGGHSLLATRVLSRVEKTFGVRLPVRQLFESPTVRSLAKHLERALVEAEAPVDAIEPLPPGESPPLSFAQERLWFLQRLDPTTPSYNLPVVLSLEGELDRRALVDALTAVFMRHEVLRSRIVTNDGVPRVLVDRELTVPVDDLHGMTGDAQANAWNEIAVREAERTFALEEGPMLRARLLVLGPRRHLLLLTVHHIAADVWSLGIIAQELGICYAALRDGQATPLPPLTLSYGAYARWQRERAESEHVVVQKQYWLDQLSSAPRVLTLPTDHPRPRFQTHRGRRASRRFDPAIAQRLRAVAVEEGATFFMALLSAWSVTLSRCAHQSDLVIGTPYASRNPPETEAVVGCFINTLLLRVRVERGQSFRELMGHVRATAIDAYGHADVRIEQLVDALQPERDMSRTPLFQAVFALHNAPLPPLSLPGIEMRPLEPVGDTFFADADLTIDCWEHDDAFEVSCVYSAALFDETTVERWLADFELVAATLSASPDVPLREAPLISDEERELVVDVANRTEVDIDERPLPVQVAAAAAQFSGDAIVFGDQRLGYAELGRRAEALADQLRHAGVGRGDLVGIYDVRSAMLPVAIFAASLAGAVYVPIDPSLPEERRRFMVQDAGISLVATRASWAAEVTEMGAVPLVLDEAMPTAAQPSAPPTADGLAYAIYTSGSTGRPKAALCDHRALANRIHWMQRRYPIGVDDRVLHKTPISFDVSGWELWWPLSQGAVLVIAPPGAHRDPHELAKLIIEHEITVIHFVPSMLAVFLDHVDVDCPSLQRVFCSGESLSPQLVRRFYEKLPQAKLSNLYGPTEAAIDVSFHDCDDRRPARVPIGAPVSNTQLHVLDADLHPVPIGVVGELYIGGKQVGVGYVGRAALTAERFLPDPFRGCGARLYRTGDLARRLSNLEIEYLGRTDFQVKVRGQRIEPEEIDRVLEEHAAIAQSVTLARAVHGNTRLVATVMPTRGVHLEPGEVRDHARRLLPDAMVPDHVVVVDEMPLGSSGKVDRHALVMNPLPARTIETVESPVGALEEWLADICGSVLHVENVGRADSFFALGGNSLLAMQVVARVESDLGVRIPLRDVFGEPTVAGLAGAARRRSQDDLEPIAEVLLEVAKMSDEQVSAELDA